MQPSHHQIFSIEIRQIISFGGWQSASSKEEDDGKRVKLSSSLGITAADAVEAACNIVNEDVALAWFSTFMMRKIGVVIFTATAACDWFWLLCRIAYPSPPLWVATWTRGAMVAGGGIA
jgi:hypothetical protein